MRTLTLILLALIGLGAHAQLTAASAFANAPEEVFPLLDTNTRLDMIDYATAGLATPSANSLKGKSAITSIAPEALNIKLTESTTAQLVLLPAGSDTIVAVITTYATPGLDSTVKFYSKKWQPLRTEKYFAAPGLKDWTRKGADVKAVSSQIPFMLASATYDPATRVLTLTNNLSTLLDKDAYALISPSLNPTLTYKWTGKRFK